MAALRRKTLFSRVKASAAECPVYRVQGCPHCILASLDDGSYEIGLSVQCASLIAPYIFAADGQSGWRRKSEMLLHQPRHAANIQGGALR
jgi:glutaredoxin